MKVLIFLVLQILGNFNYSDFERAEILFKQKNYQAAIPIYETLSKESPSFSREFKFRIAECYTNIGHYQEALKVLKELEKSASGTYLEPEVKLLEAFNLILIGNYAEARKKLDEVSKNPNYKETGRVKLAYGFLYYKKHKLEEAQEKLIGINIPLARVLLARVYSMRGKPVEALSIYRELYPEFEGTQLDFLVIYGTIETLFQSGDYKGVIYEAKKFLATHPANYPLRDHVQFYLGLAYYYLGDLTKALDNFADLQKKPNFEFAAHAAYFSGNIKLILNKPDEALNYYQTARTRADNVLLSAVTFIRLSEVFLRMKNADQAYLTASQLQRLFVLEELNGIGDYIYGAISFKLGRYEDAAQKFQGLVERYQNSPFTLPAITMALISMGKIGAWDRAMTFGNLMKSQFENRVSLWADWFRLELAEANYHQGNYSIAEELYTQVAQNAQEKTLITRANVGLGWCYLKEGRYDEAIAVLDAMANIGAASGDTNLVIQSYYGMGVAQFNSGNYQEAFKDFAALVATYPERHDILPPILYYEGLAAYALKEWGYALAAWEKMVSDYPDYEKTADAAFRAADLYRRAGKYDKSITLLSWVVEHFPNHPIAPQAQYMLSQNLYSLKEYKKAIVELNKFLSLYPESDLRKQAEELMQYAYLKLSEEQPEVLDEFIAKFPNSPLAAAAEYNRAVDLLNSGKEEDAANAFLKFAIDNPKDEKTPKALLVAGQIFLKLKKYEDAIIAFKKLVTYFPDKPVVDTARYFLGVAYKNAKKYRDAINTLMPLIGNDTQHPFKLKALPLIALSYEELGELKKAVEFYIKTGEALENNGETAKALDFYKYAYNIAPSPKLREQLMNKINALGGGNNQQGG